MKQFTAHSGFVFSKSWREFFEERAAVRQCEAGYCRQVAERLAYGECIEGWWELHCDVQAGGQAIVGAVAADSRPGGGSAK